MPKAEVCEFRIGDLAVYPAHGVALIGSIEKQKISGQNQSFYVLKILDSDATIMVPTKNANSVRMRHRSGQGFKGPFPLEARQGTFLRRAQDARHGQKSARKGNIGRQELENRQGGAGTRPPDEVVNKDYARCRLFS